MYAKNTIENIETAFIAVFFKLKFFNTKCGIFFDMVKHKLINILHNIFNI